MPLEPVRSQSIWHNIGFNEVPLELGEWSESPKPDKEQENGSASSHLTQELER